MITKKDLKNYEYKTIEDYFNYIVESFINGNYSQLKKMLSKELSNNQKVLFCNWIYNNDSIEEINQKSLLRLMIIYNFEK